MTEDMVRHPGEMEQLNKYNDWIDQLRQKNIPVDSAESEALKKQFGLTVSPESETAAQGIIDRRKNIERLFEGRRNIAEVNQRKVGKNNVQEYLDANPVAKAGANTIQKIIPLGVGLHL